MVFSIDRFEGEMAVLIGEDRSAQIVPRTELPADANEGDMLRYIDGQYQKDDAAATSRLEQILRLQQKIRRSL